MTEGFFFAQQTRRGGTRKIQTAQAVAMPQGAARGRPERASAPAGGLAKDKNNVERPQGVVALRLQHGKARGRSENV